jgi:hypothetical protein
LKEGGKEERDNMNRERERKDGTEEKSRGEKVEQ